MSQKTDYLEIKEKLFGKKPLLNSIAKFLSGKRISRPLLVAEEPGNRGMRSLISRHREN